MYILYNTISATTARDIRTQLEEKTGRRIYLRTTSHPRFPPIIRYGNHEGNYRNDTQYNSKEFVYGCCNKELTSLFLANNHINCPVFHSISVPADSVDVTYPCLVRTTMFGHGGQGIHIIHNIDEFNRVWRPGYRWTPYVRLSSEYRVLVFDGVPFRIFKKVREDGLDNEELPIRNISKGYRFSLRELDKFPNMLEFINTKMNMLTPGFYGLDIGKISDTEDFLVLELNSAPGLNPNTTEMLVDRLIEKLSL